MIAGVLGCKASVTSRPISPANLTPGSTTRGPIYYLPKTVLSVKVTLITEGRQRFNEGVPGPVVYGKARVKSVSITPLTIADQDHPIEINPTGLTKASALEAKVGMTLSDDGRLIGFNAVTTDKTGEVIKEVLGAAIGVAKMAVLFSEPTKDAYPDELRMLQNAVAEAYKGLTEADADKRRAALSHITDLNKAIDDIVQRNRTVISEVTMEYTYLHDADDAAPEAPGYFANSPSGLPDPPPGIPQGAAEKFKELLQGKDGHKRVVDIAIEGSPRPGKTPEKDEEFAQGLIVVIPRPLRVTAKVSDIPVADAMISFPQFGTRVMVPAQSKAFSTSKTIVEFTAGGTPSKIEIDNGSGADKAAKLANESIASLNTALADFRKATGKDAQIAAETETLKAEKAKLDAEKALIEAQQALEEARKKAAEKSAPQPGG